ncbi:MAG: hypothetical protein A2Y98_03695 [Candidatus Portnoybacteria bacterium RBG_19FT_COMBO_36_7]|uniref:DUF5680 domain-containing protein n=1 Tax=Candidatus Portnoybacteria bacterium RBG_19FT_COMBO_36_7 TaxID=1801992 RepID=A0A1G2F642_9BACT|nr:MAG: hypothetical protein A2Y98_03695 [Candidatus Portnoybacteria bacterium RBG_19FT_COMBO_36_7]
MNAKERKALLLFLFWARQNHGYASGVKGTKLAKSGSEFRCSCKKFSYRDQVWCEDPFIGQEMVSHDDQGWIWGMNYYGRTLKSNQKVKRDAIFAFLRSALMECNKKWPHRGPKMVIQGVWVYENERDIIGSLDNFCGTEKIFYKGVLVYRGEYHGGIISGD